MITNNSICTIKKVNNQITLSHRTNSPTMFPIQRLNDKEYLKWRSKYEMITNNSICTIKKVNNQITLSHRTNSPTMFPIQRLNDKEYLVKSTGEIREYNTSSHLNPKSYKRMCVKLRDLILNNFKDDETKLITLTYATSQKRGDLLNKDLKNYFKSLNKYQFDYITVIEPHKNGSFHAHILLKFNSPPATNLLNKDLKNYFKSLNKYQFDYITVIEPHKNGSFHAHILLKFNSPPATNKLLKEKWKHGHSKVEKVKNINALAHYFTSEKKAKRLHFYPPNFKIYRSSSGIISPKAIKMTKEQFMSEYDVIKTNEYTKIITDSSDNILNQITKEYYKIQGEN